MYGHSWTRTEYHVQNVAVAVDRARVCSVYCAVVDLYDGHKFCEQQNILQATVYAGSDDWDFVRKSHSTEQ